MADLDNSATEVSPRRSGAPVPYDFRRPTKLSRETARSLEMVYETVARQWSTLLGSALSSQCQVTFEGVEQHSYDDYVSGLESPTLLAVFTPDPHPGHGFLQLALDAAFSSIDRMLGGPDGEQPSRTPTEIETALLNRLIDRMLGELRYGLNAVTEMSPQLRALEHNPQFVQIAAATDLFVVARFTVLIGGSGAVPTVATVALPMSVLVHRASTAPDDEPEVRAARRAARATMTALVDDVDVDVRVRFLPRAMPSDRIMRLGVGDVVRLHHGVARPLDVVASGVVCAQAVGGTQGVRTACLIVSTESSGKASA